MFDLNKKYALQPEPGVEGTQAVAIKIEGDKVAFYGCGFYSAQNVVLDSQVRDYFKNCH